MSKLRTRMRWVTIAGVLAMSTLALTGCPDTKGPAEQAGEKIDEAVDEVKNALDPKGPAEKLGEKVDNTLDD